MGDDKDRQAVEKALSSGNNPDLEKIFSVHSVIALLVWVPANPHEPVKRILHTGTASFPRISAALDKCKSLTFLNASSVALSAGPIPAPSRPAQPKPTATARRSSAGNVAARGPARPASGPVAQARTIQNKAAPPPKAPMRSAAPPPARTSNRPTSSGARPPAQAPPPATAMRNPRHSVPQGEVMKKKTVAPVAGARMSRPSAPAPSKPSSGPAKPASGPAKPASGPAKPPTNKPPVASNSAKPSAAPPVEKKVVSQPVPVPSSGGSSLYPTLDGDDGPQLVVIPPTPEPPKEDIIEKPSPPQAEPVLPSEPEISHELVHPAVPSAPGIGDDIPASAEADHDPFSVPIGPVPPPADPLINFDPTPILVPQPPQPLIQDADIPQEFKTPFVPEPPGASGLLDDLEEPMRVRKISMDTDKAEELLADIDTEVPRGFVDSPEPSGDRTINADSTGDETVIHRPAHEAASEMIQTLGHDAIEEAARKLSEQLEQDGTTSVVTAFASTLIEEHIPLPHHNGNGGILANGDVQKNQEAEEQHEAQNKVAVMQTRASVVSNDGVTVKMEDDPILDQVLDTVAAQSEIVDAHKDEKPVLHLQPSKAAAQVKISRPFYFDLVTLPHNSSGICTLNETEVAEYFTCVRSVHYVFHTKDVAEGQLNAILEGKKTWNNKDKKVHIYPTTATPNVASFHGKLTSDGATNQDVELHAAIDHSTLTIGQQAQVNAVKIEL
ncbi:hypothetical protein WR25_21658 [Diploscapter pachys]|uniref:Uncharacterized protein n=1 Tax=Diploscapter pachys TaxID=2018661 RepID=A0A2A2LC46_9BILA|nr:hypothetical protein WR25_21658 [Diploscapter pachys]